MSRGFVWSGEQKGSIRAGEGSVEGRGLRPAWCLETGLESQAQVRESLGCSDLPDCAPGDLHLPDRRGWCSPPGWDPARRRPGHLGECVCKEGADSAPCPFLCRGCFCVTGAGFWESFSQLLNLLREHLIWVVIPCLVVGAVTAPLFPNALCECFPQQWHGRRGHGSTAPAWCPSGAWLAARGLCLGEMGSPLGHSGVAGSAWAGAGAAQGCCGAGQGYLSASLGTLAPVSRPVRAALTALTSCLYLLVLAPLLRGACPEPPDPLPVLACCL